MNYSTSTKGQHLVATRSQVLILMVASFMSAILALLLALSTSGGAMMFISIPGFAVGAFFAIKYFTFGKSEQRAEEHRRNRKRSRQ